MSKPIGHTHPVTRKPQKGDKITEVRVRYVTAELGQDLTVHWREVSGERRRTTIEDASGD